MVKSGFSVALALALIACDDKGTDPVSSPETFLSGLKPGDSRLLLRELKAEGKSYGFDIFSLAEIHIDKDTAIEGSPAKAFTITASEFNAESTQVFTERRYLAAQGDSLNLYSEKEGHTGFLFSLLKRSAYDTARFSDKMAVWVFPLVAGSHWKIRPPEGGSWSLEKEWIGRENLVFDGRDYACEVFVLHSVVDLKSWVASVGLLKAEIEYGPHIFTDSLGNDLDTAKALLERYELLKLNPAAAEIAAAKAKYRSLSTRKLPPSGLGTGE